MLHKREIKKNVFWRFPIKRSHREVVILILPDSKLLFEIFKRIEFMTSIEFFIIFSVAALDFSVMSGRKRANFLVLDSHLGQRIFKER